MYLILLFFLSYAHAAEKPKIFSYRIITLRDYDFFNQMQLEKKMEKPWLVLFFMAHDQQSKDFVPIYDKLAEDFKTANIYFAAVDIYENEDVRDRIIVPSYPQLRYFDTDSLMYRYTGPLTLESITTFLNEEQWKNQGKKIPKQINHWKRILRKATSFQAIFIYTLVLSIIGLVMYYQYRSRKSLLNKIRRIDIAQQNIQAKRHKYLKVE